MMKRHGAYLEDGFPLPNYSPEQHLEWMDRMSIDYSLLELSSPSPFFHGYLQESIDMYRRLNEYTADLKQKYPKRFGFQAVLPLPDVDAAIEEAIRAIRDLNADGIKFASNARGQYLGAKELEPLMQELDCLGVVCTIHPHRPEPLKEGLFRKGALALEQAVVQKNVDCILFNWNSSVAIALMDVAAKYQIPFLFGLGSADTIVEKWKDDPETYSYYMCKGWPDTILLTGAYYEFVSGMIEDGTFAPRNKKIAMISLIVLLHTTILRFLRSKLLPKQ